MNFEKAVRSRYYLDGDMNFEKEILTRHYLGGSIAWEEHMMNGSLHGMGKFWNDDGNLRCVHFYDMDVLEGEAIGYEY